MAVTIRPSKGRVVDDESQLDSPISNFTSFARMDGTTTRLELGHSEDGGKLLSCAYLSNAFRSPVSPNGFISSEDEEDSPSSPLLDDFDLKISNIRD